ncbi:MAG: hypothetical protein RIS76_2725 [Verrucomicrobiota bacterium]|jgi:transcription antitermination factor NusG
MDRDPRWFVAHTRPRCEKKVAAHCVREGLEHSLPLYRSVKRYRGKKVVFLKPLFPGYVFVKLPPGTAGRLRQLDPVAAVLDPPDQTEFTSQLADILRALDQEVEVRWMPEVVAGQRVRIRQGPLRGLEGVVAERAGEMEVILRLEFISQAAAVRVSADDVEPA